MQILEKKKKENEVLTDDSFKLLERTLAKLQEKYQLSPDEILRLIDKQQKQEILLPISIFSNEKLSSLETITKYLKEEIKMRFCEIAFVLNRDDRTIWDAYANARAKMPEHLLVQESRFAVPVHLFRNRVLAVLEVLTEYLKDDCNLRFCQIAALLNRDDRTIWTVYHRVKKKRFKEAR